MTGDPQSDKEWEDLVRRLGGTPDQARSEPTVEPPSRSHTANPSSLSGPRDYTVAEENVEDFQPPEPQPIATGNPRTLLSWSVVVGSVLTWLLATLLGTALPWWLSALTIAAFLSGALSLFFLLPRTRDHHDPSDDGDYGSGAQL